MVLWKKVKIMGLEAVMRVSRKQNGSDWQVCHS
jgi:hypothetical protein